MSVLRAIAAFLRRQGCNNSIDIALTGLLWKSSMTMPFQSGKQSMNPSRGAGAGRDALEGVSTAGLHLLARLALPDADCLALHAVLQQEHWLAQSRTERYCH